MTTNRPQEIQFERLELGGFNELDGKKVAKDLREHPELWDSFVFGRFEYFDLIELRDLAGGILNADTLMLLVPAEKLGHLYKLAKGWKYDEIGHYQMIDGELTGFGVGYYEGKEELWKHLGGGLAEGKALVRVWWD